MGVFGDWAEKYYESGYIVCPIDPETKACRISSWNSIFVKDMSVEDLSFYADKYNHWDIGLVCGTASGVAAVDFDWVGEHHQIYERMILGILPPSPVEKTGGKKWTKFYKNHESLKLKHIKWQKTERNFLDIISDGPGYTVIPPSSHSAGNKYRWTTDTSLLDVSHEDLPVITEREVALIEDIAKLDLTIVHESAQRKSNRSDYLFGACLRLSDLAISLDALISDVMELDKKIHANNPRGPYFSDVKYRRTKTAEQFARYEVSRWTAYKTRHKAKSGVVWDIGANINYPTKGNNFYTRHPKLGRDGLELHDNDGNIIYTERPDYDGMACYLKDELGLKSMDGVAYIYNGKNHETLSELGLKKIVSDLLGSKYNPATARNFTDAVRTKCYVAQDSLNEDTGFLNMNNGILDISRRELIPHTKSIFFKYHLETDYNRGATCPRWLEFLNFIFQGSSDLISASQEIFGYCIQGGNPWLHKAFFLYGSGRNGKSTWLDTLVSLVGESNRSAVPLSGLIKPFSVVMADGKLVNAVSEGETRDLSSEAFKSACSGDTLVAAHKGKPEFAMPWTARMIVSLNNLPNFRDSSVGNIERAYIIPFDRYIKPEERDREIKNKIRKELPGILNWSLDGLDRLLARGRLLELPSQTSVMEEYKENSDTTYEWFKEWVKPSATANRHRIGVYYAHYVNWTRDAGRFPVHKNIFVKNINAHMKTHFNTPCHSRIDGKLVIESFSIITASSGNNIDF